MLVPWESFHAETFQIVPEKDNFQQKQVKIELIEFDKIVLIPNASWFQ